MRVWSLGVSSLISRSSIPGSGRSPGGRNDNPLQYFCLGNPKDKDVWWATVSAVAKSPTGRLTTPPSLVPGPPAQLHRSVRPWVSNKLQGEANTAGGGTLLWEARIYVTCPEEKTRQWHQTLSLRGDWQGPDQGQRGEHDPGGSVPRPPGAPRNPALRKNCVRAGCKVPAAARPQRTAHKTARLRHQTAGRGADPGPLTPPPPPRRVLPSPEAPPPPRPPRTAPSSPDPWPREAPVGLPFSDPRRRNRNPIWIDWETGDQKLRGLGGTLRGHIRTTLQEQRQSSDS